MWSQSTNVTDRRTDRHTDDMRSQLKTALCTKVHCAVKTKVKCTVKLAHLTSLDKFHQVGLWPSPTGTSEIGLGYITEAMNDAECCKCQIWRSPNSAEQSRSVSALRDNWSAQTLHDVVTVVLAASVAETRAAHSQAQILITPTSWNFSGWGSFGEVGVMEFGLQSWPNCHWIFDITVLGIGVGLISEHPRECFHLDYCFLQSTQCEQSQTDYNNAAVRIDSTQHPYTPGA